jgi:molecular chaperone HtpG
MRRAAILTGDARATKIVTTSRAQRVSNTVVKLVEGETPPFVSGVLRRFGEDIHEDPLVAYRALVDRAHGACMRRTMQANNFSASILVATQTLGGTSQVSICDNGEALAAAEVRTLYAAIRTGRAGAVRRALLEAGADGADSIIGRLGVALLAAFLIADQVTISTRSHLGPPDAGIRFTCNSRTYLAEPLRIPRAGTIITLRVRRDHAERATVDAIRAALIDHARTLPLPIRVGPDLTPINSAA